ncbi:uncharacterized protein THITE_2126735 [Thermothielavioides terrestris NRRL 8126]|uniref:Uncharacterized protein n=1 Tax=Thermothielavioides terrestris (strain ATCC 38088 / NRRL 8126) TaxID=578455 RepID=G2QT58_THETT|nr:uncharacterized protein THITE_2126735 [Thermothielavioides terrestris NRRL 8126]AEO64384.1 hypothetical protein THITE_2126735 [Thermothielavioides terrestris NRRL 8126]
MARPYYPPEPPADPPPPPSVPYSPPNPYAPSAPYQPGVYYPPFLHIPSLPHHPAIPPGFGEPCHQAISFPNSDRDKQAPAVRPPPPTNPHGQIVTGPFDSGWTRASISSLAEAALVELVCLAGLRLLANRHQGLLVVLNPDSSVRGVLHLCSKGANTQSETGFAKVSFSGLADTVFVEVLMSCHLCVYEHQSGALQLRSERSGRVLAELPGMRPFSGPLPATPPDIPFDLRGHPASTPAENAAVPPEPVAAFNSTSAPPAPATLGPVDDFRSPMSPPAITSPPHASPAAPQPSATDAESVALPALTSASEVPVVARLPGRRDSNPFRVLQSHKKPVPEPEHSPEPDDDELAPSRQPTKPSDTKGSKKRPKRKGAKKKRGSSHKSTSCGEAFETSPPVPEPSVQDTLLPPRPAPIPSTESAVKVTTLRDSDTRTAEERSQTSRDNIASSNTPAAADSTEHLSHPAPGQPATNPESDTRTPAVNAALAAAPRPTSNQREAASPRANTDHVVDTRAASQPEFAQTESAPIDSDEPIPTPESGATSVASSIGYAPVPVTESKQAEPTTTDPAGTAIEADTTARSAPKLFRLSSTSFSDLVTAEPNTHRWGPDAPPPITLGGNDSGEPVALVPYRWTCPRYGWVELQERKRAGEGCLVSRATMPVSSMGQAQKQEGEEGRKGRGGSEEEIVRAKHAVERGEAEQGGRDRKAKARKRRSEGKKEGGEKKEDRRERTEKGEDGQQKEERAGKEEKKQEQDGNGEAALGDKPERSARTETLNAPGGKGAAGSGGSGSSFTEHRSGNGEVANSSELDLPKVEVVVGYYRGLFKSWWPRGLSMNREQWKDRTKQVWFLGTRG